MNELFLIYLRVGNFVGDSGAGMISEVLKSNTSLTELVIGCDEFKNSF